MSKADIIVKRNGEIRLPFHLFAKLNKHDVIEHLQHRAANVIPAVPVFKIRNLTEKSERYGKDTE